MERGYMLASLFENSGMSGSLSQRMSEMMSSSVATEKTGMKSRISKTVTKENRGQPVIMLGAGKKTICANCQKNKKDIGMVTYCCCCYYYCCFYFFSVKQSHTNTLGVKYMFLLYSLSE